MSLQVVARRNPERPGAIKGTQVPYIYIYNRYVYIYICMYIYMDIYLYTIHNQHFRFLVAKPIRISACEEETTRKLTVRVYLLVF